MFWFPDTAVLCNFAAVGRLDLLEEYLGGHGVVAESIEAEIRNSIAYHPVLETVFTHNWFPPSIRADQDGEAGRVETFRRVRMFGDPAKPKEHLGESETFVLLQGRPEYEGSFFLTDDHDAFRVMGKFGVPVKDTIDVLTTLVGRCSITADQAFALTIDMEAEGRELRRLPAKPTDLLA
jgi:predicted nucleic acid-binding protein